MSSEILIEEGVVLSSSKGFAQISLTKSEQCDECSARIICKSKDDDQKILKVSDPFDTNPGDIVKISIHGSTLIKISMILYGIPLILLLLPVFLINIFLKNILNPELISFLTGLLLAGLYYFILFSLKKKINPVRLPQIISFRRTN